MAIYIVIFLLALIVLAVVLWNKHTAHVKTALSGEWRCHYQHPYVWAGRTQAELSSPADYIVFLHENGTGEIRKAELPPAPGQTVYFSWIYENDYIIVDAEKWDNSAPIYFRLLNLEDNACKLEVFYLADTESPSSASHRFAIRFGQARSHHMIPSPLF